MCAGFTTAVRAFRSIRCRGTQLAPLMDDRRKDLGDGGLQVFENAFMASSILVTP